MKKKEESILDSSRKIFVTLLSLAIVITVIGTLVSLDNLDLLPQNNFLIGATTGTGVSNLTITAITSIANQISAIQFGNGYVNASCTECVMDSNGQQNQTGACCIGFTNVSSGFLLENTGNLNLSVNYNCSGSCTAESFIGGTNASFEIKVTNNFAAGQSGESGTADTAASCLAYNDGSSTTHFGGWNITNVTTLSLPEGNYVDVHPNGSWICGNLTHFPLSFLNPQDAAVVDINISIPNDAHTSGATRTTTITFNAYSND